MIHVLHPTFYSNAVNNDGKFKLNPHGLKMHPHKLIHKGYHQSIFIKSLNMVKLVLIWTYL